VAQITIKELQAIAPVSDKAAELFLPYIYKYQGDVNSPIRFAAFLANVLHESGCFKYVREIASGDAYEGRKDLGNVFKGDGRTFKGRGLIQLTGRANYSLISKDWFGDDTLVKNPELLATPENAVRSAYWFWQRNNLNAIADSGDFKKVCKRINGGYNGLAERQKYYDGLFKVLNAKSPD
jgi:putative chitinase